MVKGFAISDEGNIPKAQLLCLLLLCFRTFCVLTQARRPEVGGSCKFSHCLAKFCGFRGKDEAEDANGKSFLLYFLWIVFLVQS